MGGRGKVDSWQRFKKISFTKEKDSKIIHIFFSLFVKMSCRAISGNFISARHSMFMLSSKFEQTVCESGKEAGPFSQLYKKIGPEQKSTEGGCLPGISTDRQSGFPFFLFFPKSPLPHPCSPWFLNIVCWVQLEPCADFSCSSRLIVAYK